MRRWRNIPFVQKMGPERMCLPSSCAYPLAGGAKAAIVAPKTSLVGAEDGKEGHDRAGDFAQETGPCAVRGGTQEYPTGPVDRPDRIQEARREKRRVGRQW